MFESRHHQVSPPAMSPGLPDEKNGRTALPVMQQVHCTPARASPWHSSSRPRTAAGNCTRPYCVLCAIAPLHEGPGGACRVMGRLPPLEGIRTSVDHSTTACAE